MKIKDVEKETGCSAHNKRNMHKESLILLIPFLIFMMIEKHFINI